MINFYGYRCGYISVYRYFVRNNDIFIAEVVIFVLAGVILVTQIKCVEQKLLLKKNGTIY